MAAAGGQWRYLLPSGKTELRDEEPAKTGGGSWHCHVTFADQPMLRARSPASHFCVSLAGPELLAEALLDECTDLWQPGRRPRWFSVEVMGGGGDSPIIVAAMRGDVEMCKLLCEYKADVCAEDAFGERPIAAARNDTVADTLLRAGAFGKLTEDDAFYHHLRSVKRIAYKKAFGVPANF